MRLLLTNDDGYLAVGLAVLGVALLKAGHDVCVIAPRREYSGAGTSLGQVRYGAEVDVARQRIDELGDAPVFAVDGPPGLAVKLALSGHLAAPPEVVVSGINRGWNTGAAAIHSGTLGAAITACANGVSALAVSCGKDSDVGCDTAGRVASELVPRLASAPEPVALNVNVPSLPFDRLSGWRTVPLDRVGLHDVRVDYAGGVLRYALQANHDHMTPDCDSAAVRDGFVAVTALSGRYESAAY